MTKDIEALEIKLQELEPILTKNLLDVNDFNSLIAFQFTYISNYLPTLEFAVEYLKENSIAGYANFGIMIDRILGIKVDELTRFLSTTDFVELSKNPNLDKSELMAALSKMHISRKLQLSTFFTSQMSILRDQYLTQASTKYDPINKIITWANFFSHFIHNPIFHDFYMDDKTIDIAEKELLEAQKRIQNKNNKDYDYALAQKWSNNTMLSEKLMVGIPKYFIGPKLAWLEAMVGLNIAKVLLRNDKGAMANINDYTEKIIDYLTNDCIPKSKYAYRENLNSSGPSPNLSKILEENNYSFTVLDNMSILCENDKETFVIIIPSSYEFFVNQSIKIKHKLIHENGNESELDIPIWNNMFFVMEFCRSPSDFFLQYKNDLCEPSKSLLLDFWIDFSDRINELIIKSNTIIGKIELTYSSFTEYKILDSLKNIKATSVQVLIAYSFLTVIETLAKLAGFDTDADLWSLNRLSIAAILTAKLSPISNFFDNAIDDDKHRIRNRIEGKIVNNTLVNNLERDVKELTEITNDIIGQFQGDFFTEISSINIEIQKLLRSGLPIEEISDKLSQYYSTLK